MTTAPVMTITDELLAEILLDCEDSELYQFGEYHVALPTARVVALVEHIRSLTERMEMVEKDAARYRWLLTEAWFQEAFDRFSPDDGGLLSRFVECAAQIIDRQMSNDPLQFAAIAQEGQSHE